MTDKDRKLAEEILVKRGFFVMTHKEGSEHVRKVFIEPVLEAMQEYAEAWNSAKMREVMDEGRKCLGCGTPLGDYCEQCQHLLES